MVLRFKAAILVALGKLGEISMRYTKLVWAHFVLFILGCVTGAWAAGTEQVLHAFTGPDGFEPWGLVFDKAGNLYGPTNSGGTGIGCPPNTCGTVFELSPNSDGTWTETVLYDFAGGIEGAYPNSSLIFDPKGNLYGVTAQGGDLSCNKGAGCGTVFQLIPSSGGSWTKTILYSFAGGDDGAGPFGTLTFDTAGNLYDVTGGGGTHGFGTVFKLTPKSGGGWQESVLHSFAGGNDGFEPAGGVVFDKAGNLYGVTVAGGSGACGGGGCGTVYMLRPGKKGWKETVLHRFAGQKDGMEPIAAPILDKGSLVGTVYQGGRFGSGTVYELTPKAKGGWQWNVVYAFKGGSSDGNGPYTGGLSTDTLGNFYGTTLYGGSANRGTVFRLKHAKGSQWTDAVLYSFSGGSDGLGPESNAVERAGHVYGTTAIGGDLNCNSGVGCGVVFEITP